MKRIPLTGSTLTGTTVRPIASTTVLATVSAMLASVARGRCPRTKNYPLSLFLTRTFRFGEEREGRGFFLDNVVTL